jgi:hypothetical protein
MPSPTTTNTYYKESEKRKFAAAVLTKIGAPINELNVSALLKWMNQEDSRNESSNVPLEKIAINRFNPLNTTMNMGDSQTMNEDGVRVYKDFNTGVEATAKTLKLDYYKDVVDAFKGSKGFDAIKSAVGASPWGTFKGDAMTANATTGSVNVTSDIIARALLVNPEVASVFKKYKGQQGDNVMQAIATDLKATNWYQTNSERIRQVVLSSLSQDKATYNESKKNEVARIRKIALNIGSTLDDAQIDSLANQTLLFGLSDADLNTALVGSVRMDANYIKGQAGTIGATIAKGISDYGFRVNTNSTEFKTYVADVLNGLRTTDDIVGQFRNMASAQYPNLSERFKSGATLAEIAQPYKYAMSNILETNINTIDLDDPNLQSALSSGMNTFDFSRTLKKDPRWQYTQNAQDDLLGTFSKVLRQWGFEV